VNLPRISERTEKLVWIGSIMAGTAIIAIAFALGCQGKTLDELILLAVMIASFPPSIANYMDYRWKKSIDKRLQFFSAQSFRPKRLA